MGNATNSNICSLKQKFQINKKNDKNSQDDTVHVIMYIATNRIASVSINGEHQGCQTFGTGSLWIFTFRRHVVDTLQRTFPLTSFPSW